MPEAKGQKGPARKNALSVSLVFAKIEDVPGLADATGLTLSPVEQARWASLGSARRKRDFLAGRLLARCLLTRSLGLSAAEAKGLSLGIDAQGRPTVLSQHELSLSISHSGDGIACAVAKGSVGVDIEDLGRKRDFLALAEQAHSPQQCLRLANQADEARAEWFYRWWTLKEAWLKRQGLGLDLARMRRLEFVPAKARANSLSLLLTVGAQRWVLALEAEGLSLAAPEIYCLSPGFERQAELSFCCAELAAP